ncbi:hypothetical protein [Kineosporia succinea]|uniref:Membrane protein n=1 Tax=Kineosporia succinea TaxID=84632 RepID=A0ABT9NX54_9ACTN|nr:hypothetical protein [Kineosporia succinea]MDP9824896.1 putative membrane protein [Kineosporia succinea]
MTSIVSRGLLAGAAGTAVLNAITHADMAVRGRDASALPARAVERLSDSLDLPVPGSRHERSNRVSALGALAGTAGGLAVGVAASVARSAGVRLPAPVEAVAIGAGALVATEGPTALLGLTTPRSWTARDWIADAVPHLGYGIAVAAVLRATRTMEDDVEPAGVALVLRSVALGVASGCRSSLGLAAPTLRGAGSRASKVIALATTAGELVGDKLPGAPDRTRGPVAASRIGAAVTGAVTLAHRRNRNVVLPVIGASVGAVAGTWGGHAWREWAGARMPDWQAALLEDAFALTVGLWAVGSTESPEGFEPTAF